MIGREHYLYRYIRLDKNQVCYIGIGTKYKMNYVQPTHLEFSRAYKISSHKKDNSILNRILNKTEVKVEIVCESENYEEIKNKEKEFIKIYGKICNKTGTLANFTDGGDGSVGNPLYKINQYTLDGEFIKQWNSIPEICSVLGFKPSGIRNCSCGLSTSSNGFIWKYL